MGLSKAIVAIKGNRLNEIDKISEILNYFEDENLFDKISQTIQFTNGWTILQDEEMVFVTEEDLLQELSEELAIEVFSLIIQSTSQTYGFSHFNNGQVRVFLVQEGDLMGNSGNELDFEQDLKINKDVSENEILKIAEKLNINII